MRHPVKELPLEETRNTGTENELVPGTCLMCFKPFDIESTSSNPRKIYRIFENSGCTNSSSGENENNSNFELEDECLPMCPECFDGAAILAEVAGDLGALGYPRHLKIVTVRESEDPLSRENRPGLNPAAESMKIPNQNSEATRLTVDKDLSSPKDDQSTTKLPRRRNRRSSKRLKKDSLIAMDIEPKPSTSKALAPRFILENKENDSAATNQPEEKNSPAEIVSVFNRPSTNLPNADETTRVEENPASLIVINDEHLADIEKLMEIKNITLENFATHEYIAAVENFCDILAGTCLDDAEEIPAEVNPDIFENLVEARNLLGIENRIDAEKFPFDENPPAIEDILADENLSEATQAQDEKNPITVKNLRDGEKDLPGSEANVTKKSNERSPNTNREDDSGENVEDTIPVSAEPPATVILTPLRIVGNGNTIVVEGDVKPTKHNNNLNRRTVWERRNGSSCYTRKNQRHTREVNRRVLNRKSSNAEIQKTAIKVQAGKIIKPKCSKCGKQLLNVIDVTRHICQFHEISKDNKMQLRSSIQKPTLTLQCPKCAKQFINQLKMTNHIRAVHQKFQSGEGKETSPKIKVTIQRNEKPKPRCGICGRKFLNKRGVWRHISAVHLVFHKLNRVNSTPLPKNEEHSRPYSLRQLR